MKLQMDYEYEEVTKILKLLAKIALPKSCGLAVRLFSAPALAFVQRQIPNCVVRCAGEVHIG